MTEAPTLTVNLVTRISGVKLSFLKFEDKRAGKEHWLVIPCFAQTVVYPKAKGETLPNYRDPQKALLVLLLQNKAKEQGEVLLRSEQHPVLARSLRDAHRKQLEGTSRRWLFHLVGATTEEEFKEWFVGEGSPNRAGSCSMGLGTKWQSTRLAVYKDEMPVDPTAFAMLADEISLSDEEAFAGASISIGTFELLVWNRQFNCFARGCSSVKQGDEVQIQIGTSRPCCLYVVWVDGKGKASPLYPWVGQSWKSPAKVEPNSALIIPSCEGGERRVLRVKGPRCCEHILVLADLQALQSTELKQLPLQFEGLKRICCFPDPELLVVQRFDKTYPAERPRRGVSLIEVPKEVEAGQFNLAKPFRNRFAQVLVCTFLNEG